VVPCLRKYKVLWITRRCGQVYALGIKDVLKQRIAVLCEGDVWYLCRSELSGKPLVEFREVGDDGKHVLRVLPTLEAAGKMLVL
jgi:hypothetical protein